VRLSSSHPLIIRGEKGEEREKRKKEKNSVSMISAYLRGGGRETKEGDSSGNALAGFPDRGRRKERM